MRVLFFVLISTLMMSSCRHSPFAKPVQKDSMHIPVLENEDVRVLDIQMPVGMTTEWHRHHDDIFYVVLNGGPLFAETWDGEEVHPNWKTGKLTDNKSYTGSAETHRVTNVGSDLFRMVGIENLHRKDKHLNPSTGRVVELGEPAIEDKRFRAWRIVLQAGQSMQAHRHNSPLIMVQESEGTTEDLSVDTGEKQTLSFGQFAWHPAETTHSYTNTGTTPVSLVEVEIR